MADDPCATAALRDWPCTNPDHLGLCGDDHVHTDHVMRPACDHTAHRVNDRRIRQGQIMWTAWEPCAV